MFPSAAFLCVSVLFAEFPRSTATTTATTFGTTRLRSLGFFGRRLAESCTNRSSKAPVLLGDRTPFVWASVGGPKEVDSTEIPLRRDDASSLRDDPKHLEQWPQGHCTRPATSPLARESKRSPARAALPLSLEVPRDSAACSRSVKYRGVCVFLIDPPRRADCRVHALRRTRSVGSALR